MTRILWRGPAIRNFEVFWEGVLLDLLGMLLILCLYSILLYNLYGSCKFLDFVFFSNNENKTVVGRWLVENSKIDYLCRFLVHDGFDLVVWPVEDNIKNKNYTILIIFKQKIDRWFYAKTFTAVGELRIDVYVHHHILALLIWFWMKCSSKCYTKMLLAPGDKEDSIAISNSRFSKKHPMKQILRRFYIVKKNKIISNL